MKLANACGCGTLYTAGIASRRMLAVIPAFMVGVLGVLAGTAARPPAIDAIAINWGSVSLANELSWSGALVVQLAALGLLALLARLWAVRPRG